MAPREGRHAIHPTSLIFNGPPTRGVLSDTRIGRIGENQPILQPNPNTIVFAVKILN